MLREQFKFKQSNSKNSDIEEISQKIKAFLLGSILLRKNCEHPEKFLNWKIPTGLSHYKFFENLSEFQTATSKSCYIIEIDMIMTQCFNVYFNVLKTFIRHKAF